MESIGSIVRSCSEVLIREDPQIEEIPTRPAYKQIAEQVLEERAELHAIATQVTL